MEIGKTERGEEIQPVLKRNGDDGRRRALIILLISSLPLPLPSLLWMMAQWVGGAGRGEEIRIWRGGLVTVAMD